MEISDERLHELANQYGIKISPKDLEQETSLLLQQRLHQLKYQGLETGDFKDLIFADREQLITDLMPEAHRNLMLEAVLKAVIKDQQLEATAEELEQEAQRLADQESTTLDFVRSFFGDDYALLKRDVLERKALAIIAE